MLGIPIHRTQASWVLPAHATAALYSATANLAATGLHLTKYTSSERAQARARVSECRLALGLR